MNQEIKNDVPENNLNLPVRKVCVIAERLINELQGAYEDYSARLELNDLIGEFLNQQEHSGDADDYHDLAAILGSGEENILACNVLDCGLKYFPQDVDLLADYLLYGPSCNGNKEYYTTQCQKYYEILSKIPKRLWTWRGFSFSINYLFNIKKKLVHTNEEVDSLIDESLKIVHEYRKLFPKSEESYRIEAIIYKNSNKEKKQLSILETALKTVNKCPKCALMYANLSFENGDYREALTSVKRAIADSSQIQNSIYDGYLYFMSALCKIAISQKEDVPLTEENILDIYSDLNIALPFFTEKDSNYKTTMKNKLLYLLGKYNIPIPYERENLYEFAQQIKNN